MRESEERVVVIPASRGEGTGDGDENDLLAGAEGVDGDALELIVLVEVDQHAVGNHVAGCYRRHLCLISSDLPTLVNQISLSLSLSLSLI